MYNDQVYNPTTYSPTQQQMAYGNMSIETPAVHGGGGYMDSNEPHSPLLSPRKDVESGLAVRHDASRTPRVSKITVETRIECVPKYIYSPWGILRALEMCSVLFTLGLFTVTCGGWGATCVVYINEFGRIAQGLGYNVFAGFLVFILSGVVYILYSINFHRYLPGIVAAERAIWGFCIFLLFLAAICMSIYASMAGSDEELYNMTRLQYGGIQGAWIAAAVFHWINFLVYLGDLIAQCAVGYPSVSHVNS